MSALIFDVCVRIFLIQNALSLLGSLLFEVGSGTSISNPETTTEGVSMSKRIESLTIKEDVQEGEAEDDESVPVYPYDRINTDATDPITDIDVTKREVNENNWI